MQPFWEREIRYTNLVRELRIDNVSSRSDNELERVPIPELDADPHKLRDQLSYAILPLSIIDKLFSCWQQLLPTALNFQRRLYERFPRLLLRRVLPEREEEVDLDVAYEEKLGCFADKIKRRWGLGRGSRDEEKVEERGRGTNGPGREGLEEGGTGCQEGLRVVVVQWSGRRRWRRGGGDGWWVCGRIGGNRWRWWWCWRFGRCKVWRRDWRFGRLYAGGGEDSRGGGKWWIVGISAVSRLEEREWPEGGRWAGGEGASCWCEALTTRFVRERWVSGARVVAGRSRRWGRWSRWRRTGREATDDEGRRRYPKAVAPAKEHAWRTKEQHMISWRLPLYIGREKDTHQIERSC
jgi:hypothetical protein